jgi:hypothetical protein
MNHVFDFLATIGCIVCVAVGVLLIMALAAHVWTGVRSFRRAFRESYKQARYPTSAHLDQAAYRAATEAGYVHAGDYIDHVPNDNVHRLHEADHDRAA